MQIKSTLTLLALVAISGSLFFGCSGGGNGPSDKDPDTPKVEIPEDKSVIEEHAEKFFYSLSSPIELSTLIKSTGGNYRKDLLLDPKAESQYQSTTKRALILGLYGADLSYSTIYNQQGQAVKYLAASKRIGSHLGIHEAFTADIIERANANIENRDSMLTIMTEMYWLTSSQLQEESRDQTSLLVMTGGWIEGLYLGCSLLDPEDPDPDLVMRLSEQKYNAEQLEMMLGLFPEDQALQQLKSDLGPLFSVYRNATIESESSELVVNESSKSVTIGGTHTIKMDLEDLNELKESALEIRAQIVAP